ncbi:MAG: class I SAM-dependent methyltransferase [Promethearchaeota archaeon]
MEEIPPNLASSGAIEIADKLKLIFGGKMLDIGTGDGDSLKFLIDFLKDYESAVGIDTDRDLLNKAKSRFKEKKITLKVMNGEKIEYPNDTFNLVHIAFSLHHMQNLNKTLFEMKRVLKNGGYFLVQEMFSDGIQTEAQKNDKTVHEMAARIDRMEGKYHRAIYTRDEILNFLSQLKLKNLDIFESTRDVKCLKCEEKFNCDDPYHPDIIKPTIEGIEKKLEQIKQHKEYSEFKKRAETIKKNVRKHGITSTSILFCIGKK